MRKLDGSNLFQVGVIVPVSEIGPGYQCPYRRQPICRSAGAGCPQGNPRQASIWWWITAG